MTRRTSDAQLAAAARYQKKTRQVMIRLNPDTDADMIAHLEKCGASSMSSYIKALIRADMEKRETERSSK